MLSSYVPLASHSSSLRLNSTEDHWTLHVYRSYSVIISLLVRICLIKIQLSAAVQWWLNALIGRLPCWCFLVQGLSYTYSYLMLCFRIFVLGFLRVITFFLRFLYLLLGLVIFPYLRCVIEVFGFPSCFIT